MDLELFKTLADLGLGGLALVLYTRHGKILANHEERITILEATPRPRRKRR